MGQKCKGLLCLEMLWLRLLVAVLSNSEEGKRQVPLKYGHSVLGGVCSLSLEQGLVGKAQLRNNQGVLMPRSSQNESLEDLGL